MSEDSVEFIRKLVACPELSESEIRLVLTAAGADELLPDGNRKLAHVGLGVTGFLIDCSVVSMDLSRGFTSNLKSHVNSVQHRADIAKRTGIDKHLKFNCRSGAGSPVVLALATSALIGAIYWKKKSFVSVTKGLYSLGVLDENNDGLSLMGIFEDEQSDLLLMPPWDGNNPSQAKEIDFMSQEAPPFLDFSTPPGFSNFERHYDEEGQLQDIFSDGFHFTSPGSQSLLIEESGRPVEEEQICEILYPILHREVPQGRLHEVNISPQQAEQHALPPTVDFHIMVNQHSSNKRSLGKRKSTGSTNVQKRKDICFDLGYRSSLCREVEKSRLLGLPHPENTYFRPEIVDDLLNLGSETFPTLCTFLLEVGGSQSLVALRAALQYTRENRDQVHSVQSHRWLSRDLTINERFKIIGEIDDNADFLQILRCNHILHLYRCTDETVDKTVGCSSSFAIEAPHNEFISQPRPRGNPRKMEVAIAVNKMMENIFPDLEADSAVYKSRRRTMLGLRKFGQRLHILTQYFGGDAILSLIHFDRSVDVASPVTIEKIILAPADEMFERFVNILEKSQGKLLREITTAATSAFEHLLYEDRRRQNLFALERMTPEDILKTPKESQGLQTLLR